MLDKSFKIIHLSTSVTSVKRFYQGIPSTPLVLLLQRSEAGHALSFDSIVGTLEHS